jgi:hypothetical protein
MADIDGWLTSRSPYTPSSPRPYLGRTSPEPPLLPQGLKFDSAVDLISEALAVRAGHVHMARRVDDGASQLTGVLYLSH